MADRSGWATFLYFGIGQGLLVVLVALLLRAPRADDVPVVGRLRVLQTSRDLRPIEMVKTPTFALLYVMFTMVATGGLMAVAQLAPMARDFRVADVPVSVFGLTMAALPFALSLDRVLNGLTRPFFGWVSDHLGRENTMFIAFLAEAAGITRLLALAHIPLMFVVLSGVVFFAWGEIYSLFPAISGDLFGRRYATTNYGLLYTAKGTASLLVPIGRWLQAVTGSWIPIFLVAIVFDVCAACLALFVLKPLRLRDVAPPMPARTTVAAIGGPSH